MRFRPSLVVTVVLSVLMSWRSSSSHTYLRTVITNMIKLAEQGNHKGLMIDTAEKSYSENYLKKYRLLYPLLGRIGKPKSYNRFLIQSASCVQHNTYEKLGNIVCPTLVIGGDDDKIVGVAASIELADKITLITQFRALPEHGCLTPERSKISILVLRRMRQEITS